MADVVENLSPHSQDVHNLVRGQLQVTADTEIFSLDSEVCLVSVKSDQQVLLGHPSVIVAGVRIDAMRFNEVVDAIVDRVLNSSEPTYVVTPNINHVVLNQEDKRFRDIYRRAFLVVPDGVPLLWAARLLGQRLTERVNGTDLFESLSARAARLGLRIFLLGGREGAAEASAHRLRARHPDLVICGTYCPPFGFENDPLESEKIISLIVAARPQLLFVALGTPKQEFWIQSNIIQAGVPVSLGIGASFEFVGGLVARAPRWMQRIGLEWLHRLVYEPARLWRRYLFGIPRFCFLIMRQYILLRTARSVFRDTVLDQIEIPENSIVRR